jgi:hypothetical protein
MSRRAEETVAVLAGLWRARFRDAIETQHGLTKDAAMPAGLGLQGWIPKETDHYWLFVANLEEGEPRAELGVSCWLLDRVRLDDVTAQFRGAVETAANNPGIRWFLPLLGEILPLNR